MDLSELKKVAVYDGYRPTDPTIQAFWEVRVLLFSVKTTGRVGFMNAFDI